METTQDSLGQPRPSEHGKAKNPVRNSTAQVSPQITGRNASRLPVYHKCISEITWQLSANLQAPPIIMFQAQNCC